VRGAVGFGPDPTAADAASSWWLPQPSFPCRPPRWRALTTTPSSAWSSPAPPA